MGRMGSRAGGCRRHTSFFGSSSCLDGRRARSAARARFLRGTTDGCRSFSRAPTRFVVVRAYRGMRTTTAGHPKGGARGARRARRHRHGSDKAATLPPSHRKAQSLRALLSSLPSVFSHNSALGEPPLISSPETTPGVVLLHDERAESWTSATCRPV